MVTLAATILAALINALSPVNLLWSLIGTVVGIIIGALPGLSASTAVALFIPVTFNLRADTALLTLGAAFGAATFGGAITAILIGTPGTPDNVFTVIDGYPMSQQGLGSKALGIATVASFVGGVFSTLVLLVAAPPLAQWALAFGPAELFLVTLMGVVIVAGIVKEKPVRGLLSAMIGLLLATVGMDSLNGSYRFTMGQVSLFEGLPLVPVVVGLFSAAQALWLAWENRPYIAVDPNSLSGSVVPRFRDLCDLAPTFLKSAVIGTIVGIIPAAGATIAAGISYNEAKRASKHPETFGHGEPHGLAAAEASNNAVVGGSLVPLLTLSIPGCGTAAIFLGGLLIHGLNPGSELFTKQAHTTYTLILGLFIANLMMLALGLGGARLFAKVTTIPNAILVPLILLFSVIGSYAVRNSVFDVFIMLLFAVLGFAAMKTEMPVAPFVLGFVLGPLLEAQFRRALMLAGSTVWTVLFGSPLRVVLFLLDLFCLIGPFMSDIARFFRGKRARGEIC